MYTEENDATRLERGHGSDLDPSVLTGMLSKLSVDPSSGDFINPLAPCIPLCLDQAMRSMLFKEFPTLDDIDITPRQMSNQPCGVHIPRTDVANSRRSVDAASGPGKGKEKTMDIETSYEEMTHLEWKKRQVHSDGSTVDGLPLPR
jgi:hypothetical protein